MRVAIRADASPQIGSGHVMRCLTLADELRGRGASVTFLIRASAGPLLSAINARGHRAHLLPDVIAEPAAPTEKGASGTAYASWLPVSMGQDADASRQALAGAEPVDWLIVDHYALDHRWEQGMRSCATRIFAIDDLADRKHDCDLLLDQNDLSSRDRYGALVPAHCRKLLGPRYALLRGEFASNRDTRAPRDGTVRRILVFFGGADAGNETSKVLQAIGSLGRNDIAVDAVAGAMNPHIENLRQAAQRMPNVTLHHSTPDMATLMASADLAVGAGGSATWERCCLGLPTVIIAVAENQRGAMDRLSRELAGVGIGMADDVTPADIAAAVRTLILSPPLLRSMSQRAAALVEGRGTSRVADALFGISARIVLRAANIDDADQLLAWRNDPKTRAASHSKHEISRAEHHTWLSRTLADRREVLLIAEAGGRAAGVVRFSRRDADALVSVTVAPQMRGKGLGAMMLEAGRQWIAEHDASVSGLVAEIASDNAASQRTFREAGYVATFATYRRPIN